MGKYIHHPPNSDLYKPAIQDKPYPFGKLEKRKYELWVCSRMSYSFVTTIRPHNECVDILLDKLNSLEVWGTPRLFMTKRGIRKTIGR